MFFSYHTFPNFYIFYIVLTNSYYSVWLVTRELKQVANACRIVGDMKLTEWQTLKMILLCPLHSCLVSFFILTIKYFTNPSHLILNTNKHSLHFIICQKIEIFLEIWAIKLCSIFCFNYSKICYELKIQKMRERVEKFATIFISV